MPAKEFVLLVPVASKNSLEERFSEPETPDLENVAQHEDAHTVGNCARCHLMLNKPLGKHVFMDVTGVPITCICR